MWLALCAWWAVRGGRNGNPPTLLATKSASAVDPDAISSAVTLNALMGEDLGLSP